MADTYEHGYEDGRLDGLIYAYEVAGRSDLADSIRIQRAKLWPTRITDLRGENH